LHAQRTVSIINGKQESLDGSYSISLPGEPTPGSSELRQILADAPAARKAKKSVLAPSVEEVEEVGGSFELGVWV